MGACHLSLLVAIVAVTSVAGGVINAKARLKIVGGHEISLQDTPNIANIYISRMTINGFDTVECTGKVITDYFILTAASCFEPELPDDDVLREEYVTYGNGSNQINVEKYICHEEYNKNNNVNDICLVKLAEPIEFVPEFDEIQPSMEELPEGTLVNITGWGREHTFALDDENQLRQVTVPVISNEICAEQFFKEYNFELPKTIFCVGNAGQGACYGDSGAPITYEGRQVGIAIRAAYNICEIGIDYVIKVSEYFQWIVDTIIKNY